jgi:hypothetical protein
MMITKAMITPEKQKKSMKPRNKWPFSEMTVGQTIKFDDPELIRKAQPYVHVFARSTGMSFTTGTTDGVLYVKRLS